VRGDLKIAFNVLEDRERGDYEIYAMNPDGSGVKNISNRRGVDWVYHALGGTLYFVSDRDTTNRAYFLYTMDAEGNNVRKAYPYQVFDSWLWTRDGGRELVLTGYHGKKKSLVIIDSAGREVRTLLSADTSYFNDPAFSPDGRHIVFRYKADRKDTTTFDELWIMDEDGSGLRRLTWYPAGDSTNARHEYHAGPPFWEPNRNIISYTSRQRGDYSIFTIRPDGTGLTQLTQEGFNEGWHAWSPDGGLIVYDGSDLEGNNYDIFLMHADGSFVRRLTTDPRVEQAPVFVRAPR
jgi:TolB protein